jgi:uncharacterized membrane protein YeaQ/YmgE (transglycosylase-associated protein family)
MKPLLTALTKSITLLALGTILLGSAPDIRAADEPGLTERAKTAAVDAKDSVQEAGRSAMNSVDEFWRSLDAGRFEKRTRDKWAAWIIMGLLVGGFAGFLCQEPGVRIKRLLLGVVGGIIGGILLDLTQLKLHLGAILISSDEMVYALGGALLILVLARFWSSRSAKKKR